MIDYEPVPEAVNELTGAIVDAALTVHKELGPGLLESVYEACLAKELELRELQVERQVRVPLVYRGHELAEGLRLDLRVERSVVVEVKAVDVVLPVHAAQILSYLKLSGHRVGLLLNFNVAVLKTGIHRFVL